MIKMEVNFEGLAPVMGKLEALGLFEVHVLTEVMARTVQSQTRMRIAQTKTGPDGEKWAPRKEDGAPALFRTGHNLFDTIDYEIGLNRAEIGTGFVGARIHQFGGVITPKNGQALHFNMGGKSIFAKKVTMPARPFMGLNEADIAELHEVAAKTIGALL